MFIEIYQIGNTKGRMDYGTKGRMDYGTKACHFQPCTTAGILISQNC
jgi:hypothetical protein